MTSEIKRLLKVIDILYQEYPGSTTVLVFRNPLEMLVATILSAQCTDERVNKVTPGLFNKYRNASDFAKAEQGVLENEIRSTGFFRNKAKSIIGAAKKIELEYGGRVPDTMAKLITLPGVARKTANVVLSSAFKKAEGIAVDTHVKRLSARIGFSKEDNPEKIEKDLLRIVPKNLWVSFNYVMTDHGRKICMARKPLCPRCPVKEICLSTSIFYPEVNF